MSFYNKYVFVILITGGGVMIVVDKLVFFPTVMGLIVGLFMIFFPKAALVITTYKGSFSRTPSYRKSSIITIRVLGFVVIVIGVCLTGMFFGWFDSLIFN